MAQVTCHFVQHRKECEDDEISPAILVLGVNEQGMGKMRLTVGLRHLILRGNELAGGVHHPPAFHLILLFATLITLVSRLVFSVADIVVVVVAFAFQVAGVDVDVVVGMFTGASVGRSVFRK